MRESVAIERVDVSDYEFVILRVGDEPIFFRPKAPHLIIGRDTNSDISLNSPAISREHAKLRYEDGCWQIIDMGSANGTFLGEDALQPRMTAVWNATMPLRMGPYTIKQHKAYETGKTPTLFLQPLNEISRATSHFIAALTPENVTLQPQQRKSAQLTVKNHSEETLRLLIKPRNLPQEWFVLSNDELLLHPNTRKQTLLRFELPEGIPKGIHPFEIDIEDANSGEQVTVYGMLDVTQQLIHGFSADLTHDNGRLYLNLNNHGNVDDTYKFSVHNPPNASIVGHQWSSILKPEQKDRIQFGVQLRRPLIGKMINQPVSMTVRSSSGTERKAETTLPVQPYLPLWAVGTMISLLLLFGILGSAFGWF